MHWAAGKAAGGVRLEMTSAAGRSVDGTETATAEAATAMKATAMKATAVKATGVKAAAGMKAAAASMEAASAAMEAASAAMKAATATMEAATATAMEASTSSAAASGCLRQICGRHCYGGTRKDGGKRHRNIHVASSSRHVFPPLFLAAVCTHVTREHLNNS
jgi:hypothetical protein